MTVAKAARQQKIDYARKAGVRTFAFLLLVLLGHAIYEFYNSFTLNTSFYIMIGGLVFFFVNDYLIAKSAKS